MVFQLRLAAKNLGWVVPVFGVNLPKSAAVISLSEVNLVHSSNKSKIAMKIVLVGYRASGKSTLGQLLAQRLEWPYKDIDRGIEARTNKTLTELYEELGEEPFRRIETEVVEEMCQEDQCVISFGAGSVIKERNQIVAQRDALVVFLDVPVQELGRRIENDPRSGDTRPPLSRGGIEEVEEMLAKREPIYRKCADVVLDGTRAVEELVEEVVAVLREEQRAGGGQN